MRRKLLGLTLLVVATSCVTTDEANLVGHFKKRGLNVTADDAPEGAQPIKMISYYKSGFYLVGCIPVVPIYLEDAVDYMAERAHRLGADGVAHLSFEYDPAALFKFTVFPIPDWSASIHFQGMAYKLPEGHADKRAVAAAGSD